MKKKALIALILIVLLVGSVSIVTSVERSKARKALAAYKAQLRAQGEKLTFEEAGYPFPLETNANLENFVVIANRLRTKSSIPSQIEMMHFESPGRAVVSWAGSSPAISQSGSQGASRPTWEELASEMNSAAELFAELRAELEHPPRYFGWDYSDPFHMTAKNPFVQKRVAAQFLTADALIALHEHQLPRAQTNLHALTQLAQVHRSDLTVVSAMIRVAISGLALSATWEALPAEGWDDAGLLSLQRDWEAIDLVQALETGLVGERIFTQQALRLARGTNLDEQSKIFSPGAAPKPGITGLKNQLMTKGSVIYWRGHMDTDELFYLQHSQARVETLRRLRTNASATALQAEMKVQNSSIEQAFAAPLGKFQHLFSALAIANYSHAFQAAVRSETQRRMTITAIALKRFHLRNGRHPAALGELVPEFVAAVPLDPWSGTPLGYRLNPAGGFTLYSAGEDGRDDGGDPTGAGKTNMFDLWTGKDAVWPGAVFGGPPAR